MPRRVLSVKCLKCAYFIWQAAKNNPNIPLAMIHEPNMDNNKQQMFIVSN